MFCKHKYQYTQGYFVCTKCRKRVYGSGTHKRSNKRIGIILPIIAVVGLFFLFHSYPITPTVIVPAENITLPVIQKNIPLLQYIPVVEMNKTAYKTPLEQIPRIFENSVKQATLPEQTSQADSIQAVNYINTKRSNDDKNPISFDSRVYNLALARAKDVYDGNYFDHTNPQTGTCAYTMKSQFGLTDNEDVAENLFMEGYADQSRSIVNPSLDSAVDSWMSDAGHKYNLLYYGHVSGAAACYGNICAFEGLNHDQFGHGCYTASQGEAFFSNFTNCSTDQMHQYDTLNQQYESLSAQYEKMPRTATSEAEYQKSMQLYNQLQTLYNLITNFKC